MSYALIQLKMVVLIILEIGSKNPVLLEIGSFLASDSKSKRYIIYHSIKEGDYTATK